MTSTSKNFVWVDKTGKTDHEFSFFLCVQSLKFIKKNKAAGTKFNEQNELCVELWTLIFSHFFYFYFFFLEKSRTQKKFVRINDMQCFECFNIISFYQRKKNSSRISNVFYSVFCIKIINLRKKHQKSFHNVVMMLSLSI